MKYVLALIAASTLGACAAPQAGSPPSAFPAKLRALGTEPFWSLAIDGARVAYSSADNPAQVAGELSRREEAGTLILGGTLAGEAAKVAVRRESCSDGMSDRTYPFALTITWGARNLRGCASAVTAN